MQINPAEQDVDIWSALRFGIPVSRAAAALPQTAASALFNVRGGRVAILGIVGEVTTAIQAQANAMKLIANPDVGTSVDMCTTLDVNADELGCLYGITGVPGDALVGANAGAGPLCARPLVVNAGTIDLSCAASNTGGIKWQIRYLPLDPGAFIEAA
jgi:hypothetical protein